MDLESFFLNCVKQIYFNFFRELFYFEFLSKNFKIINYVLKVFTRSNYKVTKQ